MSHGITSKDQMFSVREVPWHGLGVVLDKRPKTVAAALKAAGLDWTVEQVPLQLASKKYAGQRVEEFAANVRSDTKDVLGITGVDYEIIQNKQAFELGAAIIGHGGMWETAGSLWAGKTVWALIKLPKYVEVGGDRVEQFLLIEFSHDGTRALSVYLTSIRVVCNNTLSAARSAVEAQSVYKVRHIGNTSEAIIQARQVMQLTINYGKQFAQFGNRLAKAKMTERQMGKALNELYPTQGGMGLSDRQIKSRTQARDTITELFLNGKTVGNAPGSKWCAVNAIIEHYQHDQGGSRVSTQGRFLRATHDTEGFGQRALEVVQAA